MSIKRFGKELDIKGTEEFQAQIVQIVANQNLDIKFTDAAMEEKRQQLVASNNNAPNIDPVTSYIQEQNNKRKTNTTIPEYRRYQSSDAGKHVFAGLHQTGNKTLMLLKTTNQILVLPLNEKDIFYAKRLQVGRRVQVGAQGMVKARGRGTRV